MLLTRIEHDDLGEVAVPTQAYWGAQTQRNMQHFNNGGETLPRSMIQAMAWVKMAAALANSAMGRLQANKAALIVSAAEFVLVGDYDEHFPLVVWQTGSGSRSNINMNEVLANIANELMGQARGSYDPVHPLAHVGLSQSVHETYCTAVHVAAVTKISQLLLPALSLLRTGFTEQASQRHHALSGEGKDSAATAHIVHEMSAFAAQLDFAIAHIQSTLPELHQLPLGGAANKQQGHREYATRVASALAKLTNLPFASAATQFEHQASQDAIVYASGALKSVAVSLNKIGNDLRSLMRQYPQLAVMQDGGAQHDPAQWAAITMMAAQVIGNDASIAMAGVSGNEDVSAHMPVLAYNFLQSIRLLADAGRNFHEFYAQIVGLTDA